MVEKLLRAYKIPDDKMLVEAESFHASYLDDEADFTAQNSIIFASEFKTKFASAITSARASANDEIVVDRISKETQDVIHVMGLCKDAYIDLKFVSERAFPDNAAIGKQFGFDTYNRVRNSPDKMITFMLLLNETAEKFKVELIAKGYSQSKIDGLKALSEQLSKERKEQKKAINERPEETQDRITLMNEVWYMMEDIADAAKIIYRNNYAKLKQYQLPEPYGGSAEEPDNPPEPPQS
jgi:hypothetical protein